MVKVEKRREERGEKKFKHFQKHLINIMFIYHDLS
jgi:hypothetical protein